MLHIELSFHLLWYENAMVKHFPFFEFACQHPTVALPWLFFALPIWQLCLSLNEKKEANCSREKEEGGEDEDKEAASTTTRIC